MIDHYHLTLIIILISLEGFIGVFELNDYIECKDVIEYADCIKRPESISSSSQFRFTFGVSYSAFELDPYNRYLLGFDSFKAVNNLHDLVVSSSLGIIESTYLNVFYASGCLTF